MKPIIVLDDLGAGCSIAALPARFATAESINQLITLGCGPLRVVMSCTRADAFQLEAMNNRRAYGGVSGASQPSELVSVEARAGVHSGISAKDRATTVAVLGMQIPNPRDVVSPGHVFPRCGAKGGLLERADSAQGALEIFSQNADSADNDMPAAYVDLLNEAGAPANMAEVRELAQRLELKLYSLRDLVQQKLASSPLVKRISQSNLQLENLGEFEAILFGDNILAAGYGPKREHFVLERKSVPNGASAPASSKDEVPVVRIHRREFFADVFGAIGPGKLTSRLHAGLARIAKASHGVFLYLDVERKGASNGIEPLRDYAIGAQILVDLGVTRAHIVTDSEHDLVGRVIFGVTIVGQEKVG